MNWLNKFYKLSQIPEINDILSVIADMIAERGHENYDDPEILNIRNMINPLIRNIVESQLDPLINKIMDEYQKFVPLTRPEEAEWTFHPRPIDIGTIKIDDQYVIRISYRELNYYDSSDTSLDHFLRVDRKHALELSLFNTKDFTGLIQHVGIPLEEKSNPAKVKEDIMNRIYGLVESVVTTNSPHILEMAKEIAKESNRDLSDYSYPEEGMARQLLKIIDKYNQIYYPEYWSNPNMSKDNLYLNKDPYLLNLLKEHFPEDFRFFDSRRLKPKHGPTIDGMHIMRLPHNSMIHVLNYLKEQIQGK